MAYRLGRQAKIDLLNIADESILLFGVEQARRYHRRLTRTFELLAENPKMAREREEFVPPIRAHPCGSHVIIYRTENGDILVIRVRHGREDWIGGHGSVSDE